MDQFELITLIENDLEEYVSIYLSYPKLSKIEREELYIEILEQDPTFEEAKRALADLATSDYYY